MRKHFFGINSIVRLKEIFKKEGVKRILLVTEVEAYEKSGAKEKVDPLLVGYEVKVFSDIISNPSIEQVEKGIAMFCSFQPDLVLAVGGGSVLDTAKALNVLAVQEGKLSSYIKKEAEIKQQGKPLIAIPTTAGTGAEATHFAVVYIGKDKHSLAHSSILPSYAIVDPQFTFSLPLKITADTGMDALAQAIESYWSVNSTDESKQYSKEAIELVLENLETAVIKPTQKARIAMAKAAHLAGKAINIAQTTACHAISYPITSYFGVPHGHAVALTLPQMVVFNSEACKEDCVDQRGVEYVRGMMQELIELMGARSAIEAKRKLEELMDAIKLQRKLAEVNINGEKEIDTIITHGFNLERMKNNPRMLNAATLKSMLEIIK